jgi:hypothetical protein
MYTCSKWQSCIKFVLTPNYSWHHVQLILLQQCDRLDLWSKHGMKTMCGGDNQIHCLLAATCKMNSVCLSNVWHVLCKKWTTKWLIIVDRVVTKWKNNKKQSIQMSDAFFRMFIFMPAVLLWLCTAAQRSGFRLWLWRQNCFGIDGPVLSLVFFAGNCCVGWFICLKHSAFKPSHGFCQSCIPNGLAVEYKPVAKRLVTSRFCAQFHKNANKIQPK